MITNHTARRSFITNKSKDGLSSRQLAKMLGVSEEMIREVYDREDGESVATSLQGHASFKKKIAVLDQPKPKQKNDKRAMVSVA
jgi:transposase